MTMTDPIADFLTRLRNANSAYHDEVTLPHSKIKVNIAKILEAAGSSLDKAVSATVILADEDDFAGLNEEWVRWFPTDPPARQGAKLPIRMPGLKVSIAMIAEA